MTKLTLAVIFIYAPSCESHMWKNLGKQESAQLEEVLISDKARTLTRKSSFIQRTQHSLTLDKN